MKNKLKLPSQLNRNGIMLKTVIAAMHNCLPKIEKQYLITISFEKVFNCKQNVNESVLLFNDYMDVKNSLQTSK